MSTNRSRRIDRDAAEHLLAGAVDGTQDGPGALSGLLAAAAAPATPRELAGEEAAVTAFREAARLAVTRQSSTAPSLSRSLRPTSTAPASTKPRSRPMASCAPQGIRVPTRFLRAKAAAAAFAVTAIGGVAVAAGTGHLPGVLGGPGFAGSTGHSENTVAAGAVSAASASSWVGTARPTRPGSGRVSGSATARGLPPGSSGGPADNPTDGPGDGSPGPGDNGDDSAQPTAAASAAGPSGQAAAPGQSTPGGSNSPAVLLPLCHLWPGDDQSGTSDSRFEPLMRAAGGSNRVRTYCAALQKDGGKGGPGDKDTPGSPPAATPSVGTSVQAHPPTPTPEQGSSAGSPSDGDGAGHTPQGQGGGDADHRRPPA